MRAKASVTSLPLLGWAWGGSEDNSGLKCYCNPCGGMDPCKQGVTDGNETGVGWISMNNLNVEINPQGGVSYGVNIPDSTCSGAD